LRQDRSRPVLDRIKAWLDDKAPKDLLGKAICYTVELWPRLNVFLKEGHIDIDNNRTENAISSFVLGCSL